MRDECVVLIGVSADNRIRRLRARSLAEGREDVPFNSLRVGIASENQFRAMAAVVNVNTRSPEFLWLKRSLSFTRPSPSSFSFSPPCSCSRPALNTNDHHFLPLVVFRRRWPLNFNSPSRFDARILFRVSTQLQFVK